MTMFADDIWGMIQQNRDDESLTDEQMAADLLAIAERLVAPPEV